MDQELHTRLAEIERRLGRYLIAPELLNPGWGDREILDFRQDELLVDIPTIPAQAPRTGTTIYRESGYLDTKHLTAHECWADITVISDTVPDDDTFFIRGQFEGVKGSSFKILARSTINVQSGYTGSGTYGFNLPVAPFSMCETTRFRIWAGTFKDVPKQIRFTVDGVLVSGRISG